MADLPPYWTNDDIEKLDHATTYEAMRTVAEGLLRRIPPPVVQVCGPISTGGLGSVEKNLAAMERAVRFLQARGHHVFCQTPFETPIQRLHLKQAQSGYPVDLLSNFYEPLFKAGLIHEFHFLPGWKDSYGARWEMDQALHLNIKVVRFPLDWDPNG